MGLGALSMLLPAPVSDASAALIDLDPPLARILRYKLLIHEEPYALSKTAVSSSMTTSSRCPN